MPSFESLSPVLPNASHYTMHSPAMVDRQNRITPIATSENMVRWNFDAKVTPYIDSADAESFKRVIHMSQVAQTDCVRAESEHHHRGRDKEYKTGGSTFWMLDDNWPTESWTSLEYGGRFKLLHYAAARFNSDVTISSYCLPSITNCSGMHVHVKSELLGAVTGTLDVSAVRWADGNVGAAATTTVALTAQSGANFTYSGSAFSALLTAANCDKRDPVGTCFIQARLQIDDAPGRVEGSTPPLVPVNYQWLTLWRDAKLAATKFAIHIAAEPVLVTAASGASGAAAAAVKVTVSSTEVAPYVMVHCRLPGDFGSFDNNGMLMMPGERRTLVYTPKAFAPAGKHTPCSKASDFYAVSMNGLSSSP